MDTTAGLIIFSSIQAIVLAGHQQFGLGEEFSDLSEILDKYGSNSKDPFKDIYPRWSPLLTKAVEGDRRPLVVNDMDPEVVRKETRVTGTLGNIEGYSAYLRVEPKYNSNLFFWYFPSTKGADNSPLILWLQGGPGATSLFGLFTEIGPYEVIDGKLVERKYSWHNNYSLLFIDNPVGTGFSFTDSEEGYCKNQDQIAKQLYKGLQEFFKVFPEVRNQPFFISGESYAGKYVPSLAVEIHNNNNKPDELKINLKGFAIGNPYIDPAGNVQYSDVGYPRGLVDTPTYRTMRRLETAIDALIKGGNLLGAERVANINLHLLMTNSNYSNIYNYIMPQKNSTYAEFIDYVQSRESRASLHVGDIPFQSLEKVYELLREDKMKSAMGYLRTLYGKYSILLFSGHMDLIVAYPFTRSVVEKFSGPCGHSPWMVGGRLAGYKHKCGEIELALVHTAGHMVPEDQPEAALDLISDFIKRSTE